VSDLAAGASGVITITGRLRTGLRAGWGFYNTASVGCTTFEAYWLNNRATTRGEVAAVAPVAVSDVYTAKQNSILRVSAPGVLTNDRDGNGDALTVVRLSDPRWGMLSLLANGAFVYTPTMHYFGPDAFTYKVHDGALNSNVVTVTLNVASNWPTPLPYNPISKWLGAFGRNPAAGSWTNQNLYPRLVGDVNGDGKADIVGFAPSGVLVALSTGSGLGASQVWSTQFLTGTGWTSQDTYPRFLGDVNGDGKADLVGCNAAGVWVALSSGARFGRAVPWSLSFGPSVAADSWMSQNLTPRALGDVNGDGSADMVGFGVGGVWVALSDGARFNRATLWATKMGSSAAAGGWTTQEQSPRFVGDVNGDGQADVVGCSKDGTYVMLSTGSGFGALTRWSTQFGSNTPAGGWATQDGYPRMLADVNGDGQADLVGFGVEGVFYVLSTGSAFGTQSYGVQAFGSYAPSSGGWTSQNLYPRFAADVNGDGAADLIGCHADGVYVSLHH
jgi:hypothetical protein